MRTESAKRATLIESWGRPVTVTEGLLALFAIGLLLGLWLGQGPDRSQVDQIRALDERVHMLELQRALFRESARPRISATPGGRIPEADVQHDLSENLSIRL